MSRIEDVQLYQLALHLIPGVGSITAKLLISYLGSPEAVFRAKKRELLKIPGISDQRCKSILDKMVLKRAEEQLHRIVREGQKLIFYLDKEYPVRLKAIDDAPILLFTKGNINLNADRIIGIVGTRIPTTTGQLMCERIVGQLKDSNATIVSGLAYGVDAIAHQSAIRENLPTIGVLGSSIDKMYPASHKSLVKRMSAKGGVISEFEPGIKADKENFPKRNRIIAGLSDVLLVIESARKGGSMITAEYANNYSKDVFAVPGRPTDKLSEGCNLLIKSHKAHLLESVSDIEYIMRWEKKPVQKAMSFTADLTEDERKIYELLEDGNAVSLELLHYKSQLALQKLSPILLNLEIRGLIKSLPGKKYILAAIF